ncbi:class I SAM-dependent methyltransferase [Methanolobus mangrovi]|uniref:site-specific DNA-methyltransferase (cytosine-N(4)-specific) n=1 Tax=Methanolobus mangrovi TaxID=3072977 RepID=A0AA51UH40_9EURY|nr:class I SAM-dependent methyltransferase [Methanolobus mangrovi]WMW22779.1 class I SAM-dependent methyltransferase [Methanolobus mangrovi]
MIQITNLDEVDFDTIPIDSFWNTGTEKELKMHRIHSYPAKFPAFITTKALEYAHEKSLETKQIADIFCGCGTVAFEAKRCDIDFWGCDINPVATLIARAKSDKYQSGRLENYYNSIISSYDQIDIADAWYESANERLKYWYNQTNYENLLRLKMAIKEATPNSKYRLFFLCAFSNILKPTSKWLTKSIKPQVDPHKNPADVLQAFKEQYAFMALANKESNLSSKASTEIVTKNLLDPSLDKPKVDMIITSPPYVTSYEYADLHQLSSLWLDFAEDFRELREGSIGSLHHIYNFERELKRLNKTGTHVVFRLIDQHKNKARSVAKYFLDMQQVAKSCYSMLNSGGIALFIIGNTEYKGVKIHNAQHLAESLKDSGFNEITITKRKISNKILTPYRDEQGRFTTDKSGRKIYSEEYILIGRKL